MAKRLIVGLGNPGAEYEGTRHNIGYEVVDLLAEQARVEFFHKHDAFVGEGSLRGRSVVLAKPLTYMNRSGQAVVPLMRRYGLDPADLLVIVDDLHLPEGTLRLRPKGSAAGHNGVQDIIDRLGTDAFPRLRFGIGKDYPRGRQADYVLAPFSSEQLPAVEDALPRARDAAVAFVTKGLQTAMNRYNG